MFRPAIVLYIRDPTSSDTGKQRLVRERPKKRRPTEVSVSYSGSPGAVGKHPASSACPRAARRASHSSNGENHGSSFNPADHARPAISRTPNLDIAKVVQNRNGSALAQLGSVTQQR